MEKASGRQVRRPRGSRPDQSIIHQELTPVSDRDAIDNFRDGQLATGLVEVLGVEGWLVECARLEAEGWEARVVCPWLAGPAVGRGPSRVSAISRAHVE